MSRHREHLHASRCLCPCPRPSYPLRRGRAGSDPPGCPRHSRSGDQCRCYRAGQCPRRVRRRWSQSGCPRHCSRGRLDLWHVPRPWWTSGCRCSTELHKRDRVSLETIRKFQNASPCSYDRRAAWLTSLLCLAVNGCGREIQRRRCGQSRWPHRRHYIYALLACGARSDDGGDSRWCVDGASPLDPHLLFRRAQHVLPTSPLWGRVFHPCLPRKAAANLSGRVVRRERPMSAPRLPRRRPGASLPVIVAKFPHVMATA